MVKGIARAFAAAALVSATARAEQARRTQIGVAYGQDALDGRGKSNRRQTMGEGALGGTDRQRIEPKFRSAIHAQHGDRQGEQAPTRRVDRSARRNDPEEAIWPQGRETKANLPRRSSAEG